MLLALAVIREQNITASSVVLICFRDFDPPVNFYRKEYSNFSYADFPWTLKVWKTVRAMRRFDHWVERTCRGESYVLYIPHDLHPWYQLLATHPRCLKKAYIEEGDGAYRLLNNHKKSLFSFRDSLKRLCYRRRYLRNPQNLFVDEKSTYYCVSDAAFHWAKNKKILKTVFELERKDTDWSYDHVVLLAIHNHPFWNRPAARLAFQRLVKFLDHRGISYIGVKPHPGSQSVGFYEKILCEELEENGIKWSILPNTFLVEEYLSNRNSIVFSMGSSIDQYSLSLGGSVFLLSVLVINEHSQLLTKYVEAKLSIECIKKRNILVERSYQYFGLTDVPPHLSSKRV